MPGLNFGGAGQLRPTLSRLYGSSTKVKFASVVLFVNRPYVRELEGDDTSAEIVVLKNRDGAVGSIPCRFDVRKLRFDSAEDTFTPQHARLREGDKAT